MAFFSFSITAQQWVHGFALAAALLLMAICYRFYRMYQLEMSLEQQLEELCN